MSAIREIFQRYGAEYLERYRTAMPAWHKKVIHALLHCRTGELGANVYRCDACGQLHVAPCSCGNRQDHANCLLLGASWLDVPCPLVCGLSAEE